MGFRIANLKKDGEKIVSCASTLKLNSTNAGVSWGGNGLEEAAWGRSRERRKSSHVLGVPNTVLSEKMIGEGGGG